MRFLATDFDKLCEMPKQIYTHPQIDKKKKNSDEAKDKILLSICPPLGGNGA